MHDDGVTTTIGVELPGVDLADISLLVTDNSIEVTGEKRSTTETKNGDAYRSERRFGSFYRRFTLPFPVDADRVDASFDKGVLTIRVLAPVERRRPEAKKIAIKS